MNPSESYMNQMPLPNNRNNSGGVGPIIAVVIIIALLGFGGWYFWEQVREQKNESVPASETGSINAEIQADLQQMSTTSPETTQ